MNRACGSVAEWSKALVLGTSHFDGVGSNPTAAKTVFFKYYVSFVYAVYPSKEYYFSTEAFQIKFIKILNQPLFRRRRVFQV